MPFRSYNPEQVQPLQHVHVPAAGGLDVVTAKSGVNPGSLAECLNYEVVTELGYKVCDGMLQYVGKGYTAPKRFLKAVIPSSLNPDEFVVGGIYPLGQIGVLNVDVIAKVQYLGIRSEGVLEINYVYFRVVEGDLVTTKDALSDDLMIFMEPLVVVE